MWQECAKLKEDDQLLFVITIMHIGLEMSEEGALYSQTPQSTAKQIN